MAANTIGTGALVLTANADKMIAGLDKVGAAATKKSADINKKLSSSASGGGLVGGFLGGLVGTVVGKVLEAPMQKAQEAIVELWTGAGKFEKTLRAAAEAADSVARKLDRGMRLDAEWLGALTDPGDRVAEINRQTEALQGQLKEQIRIRDAARDWGDWIADSSTFESWQLWADGLLEKSQRLTDNAGSKASEAIAKITERIEDLNEATNRIKSPEFDPQLIGSVNQLTESLRQQADTWGMTSNQAAIAGLKAKGATDSMLAAAKDQADRLDALQKASQPQQLSGALSKGSTEAYSLIAKFQAGNGVAAGAEKKREAQAAETNRLIAQLLKAVTGAQIVQVGK